MSITTEIDAYQRFLREGPPKPRPMIGLGLYDGERLTTVFSRDRGYDDEDEADPDVSDAEALRYEARILKEPK